MRVFAIGDLHLSLKHKKEMDIFGPHWENHFEKITEDWHSKVADEDVVIIAGDISWALKFEDAVVDLQAICNLPGKKILLKGNHDYWWASLKQLKEVVYNHTYILQNNCIEIDNFAFCGSRGWNVENTKIPEDKKILDRELLRLEMSLNCGKKTGKEIITIMHFPPFYNEGTDFTRLIEQYNVKNVVFGHLHGKCLKNMKFRDYIYNNINYNLISADYIDFKLKEII